MEANFSLMGEQVSLCLRNLTKSIADKDFDFRKKIECRPVIDQRLCQRLVSSRVGAGIKATFMCSLAIFILLVLVVIDLGHPRFYRYLSKITLDGLQYLLPLQALPLVTIVVGKTNGSNEIRLYTYNNDADNPRKIKFLSNGSVAAGKPKWANYVKGVIAQFKEGSVPGFDAVIVSSVPVGGGLSSSAALEVATYTFLEALVGKRTQK